MRYRLVVKEINDANVMIESHAVELSCLGPSEDMTHLLARLFAAGLHGLTRSVGQPVSRDVLMAMIKEVEFMPCPLIPIAEAYDEWLSVRPYDDRYDFDDCVTVRINEGMLRGKAAAPPGDSKAGQHDPF